MPKTTRHGGGTPPIVTYPKGPAGGQATEEVAAAEPEVSTTRVDNPYSAWTNDELRAELGSRELATSGTKSDLIDRLLDDDTKPDTDGE